MAAAVLIEKDDPVPVGPTVDHRGRHEAGEYLAIPAIYNRIVTPVEVQLQTRGDGVHEDGVVTPKRGDDDHVVSRCQDLSPLCNDPRLAGRILREDRQNVVAFGGVVNKCEQTAAFQASAL
jgi:hypothetical protein